MTRKTRKLNFDKMNKNNVDIFNTITEFEENLPGWWWSICHCSLTRDASCGPDARVLGMDHPMVINFDSGFHADVEGTLADALRDVMNQAMTAISNMNGDEK